MAMKPSCQGLENQIIELTKQNEVIHLKFSVENGQIHHSLFKNMTEGFARCQMLYENNKPADLIFLEINDAFGKLSGLKNIVGKRVSEVIYNFKNENPELLDLYSRVSQTGISEKIEIYLPSLTMWFSISAYSLQKEQFFVIFDNITERKKSEYAIRIKEDQFRVLFTQSHVGTALVGLDKRFIRCNKAFCRFLGYTEKELIGKIIADFTHPEDLELGMKDMKQIVDGKIEFATLQKRYLRKDGVIVWGELTISIVRDENTKPLYYLPVIQDITLRHKAEETLKRSEAKLIKLNADKDNFFSIIAHDLRSPFNSVLGFSELLKEKLNQNNEFEKYIDIIISSTKNTLILLDSLLNWAKSQTGQICCNPTKVILSSIIQEIVEISNLQAKIKNISINKSQTDEIEIFVDENMLKMILQNLMSNAIKFTKSGGNINIVVKSEQNQVEISISDSGIGINEEKLNKIFDISSETTTLGTENEKGSGLGLVLCKEFVEKLNGKIWVESEEGKGSDFKFTLPYNKS